MFGVIAFTAIGAVVFVGALVRVDERVAELPIGTQLTIATGVLALLGGLIAVLAL